MSIGIMIGAEVISTLYYLPPFNLRRHGYIKPFLISLVWVISCSLVPLIENSLITEFSVWFVVSQFCFISVLCLLFDIKDAENDYLTGVNTYANKFGIKLTKGICLLFILLAFICAYLFTHQTQLLLRSIILSGFLIATVIYTNEQKHPFYFYLWVDGLLILQTILLFV